MPAAGAIRATILVVVLLTFHVAKATAKERNLAHIFNSWKQQPQDTDSGPNPEWKSSQHLTWFVADNVPEKYYAPASRPRQFGYQALGPQIDYQREQWASSWPDVDGWVLNQLRQSPLNVMAEADADIVIIPVVLRVGKPADPNDPHTAVQGDFVSNVASFLPGVFKKPHLVILNHGMQVYHPAFLDHRSSNLTFLSISPSIGPINGKAHPIPHVVGMPYFLRTHWNQYSTLTHQLPIANASLEANKSHFASTSFSIRDWPDRFVLHRHCLNNKQLCTFHNYAGDMKDSLALDDLMSASWHVIHPMGDFFNRGAWFDSVLACAIPVVFKEHYADYLPFTDVLDYSRIMTVLPEALLEENATVNAIDVAFDRFNKHAALGQLQYIHEVRHIFQYSLNPAHDLLRWDQRGHRDPRDDAFTFTMKAVMRNVCGRQQHLLPLQCLVGSS
ncbi:hypothetical protein WJX74_007296 [Apatococcus lobatus]|uniref:Exostosin GT47 domain-containing protein n=1 Tax=Apatococcus lobatus TaxID=904363 RepID=A0AAW1RIB8_9CHLO